jgi:enoyl-CoA hydratase/carnithine racemase
VRAARGVVGVLPERGGVDTDPLEPLEEGSRGWKDLLYERRDGVARITLNRPRAYNAYTTRTLRELAQAVEQASFDDAVGVIVLTGAGDRAFCTGGDVREYDERFTRRPHDYWKYMGLFQHAVESLLRNGKPTIARVNGLAVGGGNELHLACDLSVAAAHAAIGQVGVGVGSVAAGGATQWLPLVVGDRRARAMLLLNERLSAAKALEWGLVTEVVPSVVRGATELPAPTPEEIEAARTGADGYRLDLGPLDRAVDAMARRLLGMFPECLRYTKQQANFFKELAWNGTIGHAREWLALHFATPEPHEGMGAFVGKRPARVDAIRQRSAEGRSTEYFHGPPRQRCARCGTSQLPAEFRFCGGCGSPLESAGPEGAP